MLLLRLFAAVFIFPNLCYAILWKVSLCLLIRASLARLPLIYDYFGFKLECLPFNWLSFYAVSDFTLNDPGVVKQGSPNFFDSGWDNWKNDKQGLHNPPIQYWQAKMLAMDDAMCNTHTLTQTEMQRTGIFIYQKAIKKIDIEKLIVQCTCFYQANLGGGTINWPYGMNVAHRP